MERIELSGSGARGSPPTDVLGLGAPVPLPNDSILTVRLARDRSRPADGSLILALRTGSESEEVWQPTLERYGAAQVTTAIARRRWRE